VNPNFQSRCVDFLAMPVFVHYASVRRDGTAGASVRLWVVRAASPIRCSCTKTPDMEPPARATTTHVIGRGVQGYVLLKAGMSRSFWDAILAC
jgi:hypothetical protein